MRFGRHQIRPRVRLDSFLQDLQVACRFLLKRRTTTAVIILTLGVAVGSSTIAIGALDDNLWRPVHAASGRSLLTIYNTRAAAPQFQALSYTDYVSVRDRLRDRVDVAAFNGQRFTLDGIAQPTRVCGEVVSDNYFRVGYREAVAPFLGIFAALTIGIFIVACTNVAGLLIARAAERTRELAIRQALGGTRLQLFQRLASESLILTAAGGAAGVLMAWWTAPLFRSIPGPEWQDVALTFDWRLVAIAAAVSLAASLLLTTIAAWKGLRVDVQQALVSSGRGVTSAAFGQRALVAAQLAIGCVVATAAMLLLRTLWNVEHVDLGFDTADRVAAQIVLSDRGYSDARAQTFYARLDGALTQTPGVESVALEFNPVLERMRNTGSFLLPGASQPLSVRFNVVSAGYFQSMGIPIRAGRAFDRHDTSGSEPVIVINQALAMRLAGDAVGRRLRRAGADSGRESGTALRIVGIAKDVRYNGITEAAQPYVYFPISQHPSITDFDVYVHARLPAAQAIALIRSEVHQLDPELPLNDVGTLADRVSVAEVLPRSSAIASMALAMIAVFLALIGVYGMMTTSIENRRRELAVRSALGASPSRLVRRVVSEGTLLTLGSLVVGVAGSLAGTRALAGQLYGVRPHDLWSLLGSACLILGASAVAWIGPALRAARVDPMIVLRAE